MIDLTGYKLTFDEEFNTRSISLNGASTTWSDIRQESKFDAYSDIGFGQSSFVDSASGYDPFSISGGALSITAVPDKTAYGYPGNWESGLIHTRQSFSQIYGYFEMRADLASTTGAWDAFWLLPIKPANDLPGWQELDIVEHYGSYDQGIYSHIHTTDQSIPASELQMFSAQPEATSGYHTYGMSWTKDTLSFYFDGELMGTRPTPNDMHGPMYILADLATVAAADVSGAPITTKIDYIRAYSSDPGAVAVRLDAVSAPDGSDPGLYGAISATSGDNGSTQVGTAADDTLRGTSGDDILIGGAGSDIYYVNSVGDVVDETGATGIDKVYSSLSFDLSNAARALGNVENLVLTGLANISGTGNALGNSLTGNSGKNVIKGADGDDRLYGRAGNDQLDGGAGIDKLIGGAGADRLTGGADADTFIFTKAAESNMSGTGRDTILDFSHAQRDKLGLSLIDAVAGVAGNQAFDFIGTAAFSHHAGELRYTAVNGNVYVYGDINGDGATDFSVQLHHLTSIQAGDFIL